MANHWGKLLRFLPALSFWIAAAIRYAIRSTIRLPSSKPTVLRRRKAFLLCKNPCGGTAVGMGSPAQSGIAAPAQRNFQRKFALRRVWSARFVVPPTSNHSKVRNNARQESTQYRAAPGCQRGSQPLCFRRSPEEPLPRGSFGQLLRGGSTPRFFSQIRSVGSKPTRLAGHCQLKLAPAATLGSKKASLRTRQQKAPAAGKQQKTHAYFAKNNKHYQRHQTSRRLSF